VHLGRHPTLTPHQQQEASARHAAGEAMVDIARTFNVSPTRRSAAWWRDRVESRWNRSLRNSDRPPARPPPRHPRAARTKCPRRGSPAIFPILMA
jgi:hypothetical protein